ncbi:MAG: hypothetical protein N2491_04470 [Negativicutes bacterium]|nr:hypothetical protein [Negativicutes bacterium]
MAEAKRHMNKHLRSARQWLSKAEESFDREHDIRGELDLLLAQAELEHAKEIKRAGAWRYKYPLLRHGLALALAVTVATAGLGGAYWLAERERAVPIPLAAETKQIATPVRLNAEIAPPSSPAAAAAVRTETAAPTAAKAPANVEPAKLPANNVRELDNRPSQPEQELQLAPGEMQKLIRAAGKSLRGQE